MQPDLRCSGIHHRRKPYGINRKQSGLADPGKSTASSARATAALDDTVSNVEQSANLRESVILAREEAIGLREDAAHRRETQLLQREDAATVKEQEIRNAQITQAMRDDLIVKLRQANEQLVIASVQSRIIQELERSKAEMTHLANHDFLTDLPNRMQLFDRIGQSIALAKRHHKKLAVLFLDLDRFKAVNDSLGHAIGDKLLQAVAERLKIAIRSSDTVSRQGGDEFVLLLSEVSQREILTLKIEEIHKSITEPYCIEGNNLQIGATIGASIFPEDGEDAETLIRNADAAMYDAKENGRNKYQFFRQEMRAGDVERQSLEASLYQALDKQQFVLFYQAQINLGSGAITGAEALIRWRHPSRGLVLPAWFVPVAEGCGAMVPIGRWVLREACRQAQAWLDAGLPFHVISVNISRREFEDDDFVENVRSVLQETGLAPACLELELAETVLMKNLESAAGTLHVLRSMGVRISVDDFGTGYSSLSYLKRFPVDTMKIDQSFVHEISTDGDDDALVSAVIGMGNSLHHQVIAEGVETAKQLTFLRENHCPVVQGFYFNAPMIAEEFGTVLKQGVP